MKERIVYWYQEVLDMVQNKYFVLLSFQYLEYLVFAVFYEIQKNWSFDLDGYDGYGDDHEHDGDCLHLVV